jgi:integrase
MSLFKRPDSDRWWYKFTFEGKQYSRSTKTTNKRAAAVIEAACTVQLAKGLVDIEDRTPAPTLREFKQDFIDYVDRHNENKPETIRFYRDRLKRLLAWERLCVTRLDRIDEPLIEQYIQLRRTGKLGRKAGVVSVNRELATLRRILHVAKEKKKIREVPKVTLLKGEPKHTYVLPRKIEPAYLAACPPLLRDVAVLLLDTGLRVGEAVGLQWSSIHLEPAGSGRYGWLEVHDGKTDSAPRKVPLISRVAAMLIGRQKLSKGVWVFPGSTPDAHVLVTSLGHVHAQVCRPIVKGKPQYIFHEEFVIHSMRHTALTRLGEAGADAFTIMQQAGHASVTISQRYVHPTPETVERFYVRRETLDREALEAPSCKD